MSGGQYKTLKGVLDDALNHAAQSKGHERHGDDKKPFEEQVSATHVLGAIAKAIEKEARIATAKRLFEKWEKAKNIKEKESVFDAAFRLKDASKRRFLDVFGPNFGVDLR